MTAYFAVFSVLIISVILGLLVGVWNNVRSHA